MLTSNCKCKSDSSTITTSSKTPNAGKFPPFVKHFKTSNAVDAKHYIIGDSKVWEGHTWYLCDCPTHKDKTKWHTHKMEYCHMCQCWLESKRAEDSATSNLADSSMPPISDDTTISGLTETAMANAASSSSTNITALLANAFNLAGEGHALDLIADVLNALHGA